MKRRNAQLRLAINNFVFVQVPLTLPYPALAPSRRQRTTFWCDCAELAARRADGCLEDSFERCLPILEDIDASSSARQAAHRDFHELILCGAIPELQGVFDAVWLRTNLRLPAGEATTVSAMAAALHKFVAAYDRGDGVAAHHAMHAQLQHLVEDAAA